MRGLQEPAYWPTLLAVSECMCKYLMKTSDAFFLKWEKKFQWTNLNCVKKHVDMKNGFFKGTFKIFSKLREKFSKLRKK